ncbi:hypothetical protein K2173_013466 [Erythroxylum novogranatense]|uniref:glyoxylate reductase (NADP(+)) n=1 Tax=Erythroxylum novogranatense TaxID=1862640 RepID=A0AAV8SA38_9ROSI|nr:hypothetical protein K2173_013466 [Erythroxylum novogranatense]
MSETETSEPEHLPEVLLTQKPTLFALYGEDSFTSNKFRYLKTYESSLPLHQFLTTHAHSVQAILSSVNAPVTVDILRHLPNMRVVVTTSAGLDQIDHPECRRRRIKCRRRGIKVTNSGTVYSADVADLAVGLLIDVMRNISVSNCRVKQGLWSTNGDYDYPLGFKLRGKRVGIVGLGKVGSEVAKRLEGFGCDVSYNSRKQKPRVPYPFYEGVLELAADSDALIVCCGLTDQTHHLVNKEVLSALGKEGIVVNVGRGAIIDEKEMVRCLMEGEIAGAGLDVFENEPDIPADLLALDNVVLSPHCATFTSESLKDLSELVVGNLEAFFTKRPLLSD